MVKTTRDATSVAAIIFTLSIVGCLLATAVAGCNKVDDDTRQAALGHFYGDNGGPGRAISSWQGDKRSEVIRLRRAAYGLNDQWDYFDESVELKELGQYEYFIRYAVVFKNRTNNDYFTSEESYLSIGDEDWAPILLRSTTSTMNRDRGSHQVLRTESLWRCDFDAVMERYDARCSKLPTKQ